MSHDVSHNDYTIPDLVLGDTFYEWMQLTNRDIIAKLNRMETYTVTGTDGIDVTANPSGLVEIGLASVIPNGITFSGAVNFMGSITKINSTELTIDDYNIVLGAINDDAGGADALIDTAGGGGVILKRSAGPDASLLWKGLTTGNASLKLSNFGIGCSGEWKSTDYLSLTGGVGFKSGDDKFVFKMSGGNPASGNNATGPGFQITVATGPAGDTTYAMNSIRLGHHGTAGTGGAGLTYGVHFDEDGMVRIYDGVNKKLFTHDSTLPAGFTFGRPVRLRDGGTCDYANADTKEEAEVFGVISEIINDTQFVVTMNGEIRGNFGTALGSADAPLVAGDIYFLRSTSGDGISGEITGTEITVAGRIRKPMIIGMGATAGYVVQYIGCKIAPEVDTIAPVMRRISIDADGDKLSGSSTLDCSRQDEGEYTVTHDFGTSEYSATIQTIGAVDSLFLATIVGKGSDNFTFETRNASHNYADAATEVILAKDV